MNSLWTPKQVAEYLGVKPGTVYSWVKQRAIPHIVLSRGFRKQCIRFRPEQIEVWIRKREQRTHRESDL